MIPRGTSAGPAAGRPGPAGSAGSRSTGGTSGRGADPLISAGCHHGWHESPRVGGRRRSCPGRNADHRAPWGGIRHRRGAGRIQGARRVPGGASRPGAARPDAARGVRIGRVQGDQGRVRHPDHHADRQDRHRRCGAGAGVGRRRLRDEAVQAQGTDRPDQGAAAAGGCRVGRTAPGRRCRGRRTRPPGDQGRRADLADPAGIRPVGGAGPQTAAGLHQGSAAGTGLGLPARGRHPAGECARPAAALEDREGSRNTQRWWSRSAGVGYRAGTS